MSRGYSSENDQFRSIENQEQIDSQDFSSSDFDFDAYVRQLNEQIKQEAAVKKPEKIDLVIDFDHAKAILEHNDFLRDELFDRTYTGVKGLDAINSQVQFEEWLYGSDIGLDNKIKLLNKAHDIEKALEMDLQHIDEEDAGWLVPRIQRNLDDVKNLINFFDTLVKPKPKEELNVQGESYTLNKEAIDLVNLVAFCFKNSEVNEDKGHLLHILESASGLPRNSLLDPKNPRILPKLKINNPKFWQAFEELVDVMDIDDAMLKDNNLLSKIRYRQIVKNNIKRFGGINAHDNQEHSYQKAA